MPETLQELRDRLKIASKRWQCLIDNAEDIAVKQKDYKFGEVQDLLIKCGVPKEDWPYYMKTIMECRKGKSW